jgi:hypothetical protein
LNIKTILPFTRKFVFSNNDGGILQHNLNLYAELNFHQEEEDKRELLLLIVGSVLSLCSLVISVTEGGVTVPLNFRTSGVSSSSTFAWVRGKERVERGGGLFVTQSANAAATGRGHRDCTLQQAHFQRVFLLTMGRAVIALFLEIILLALSIQTGECLYANAVV